MNRFQQIAHSAKYIRNIKRVEATFIKPIYNAMQGQIKKVADVLRAHGIVAARHSVDHLIIHDHIGEIIQQLYVTVGTYSYGVTTRQINRSAREEQKAIGFGFDEELYNMILSYFQTTLLSKAVIPITETTKARILELLTEGLNNGWGVDRIAFEIENDELTLARARMIVRTESLKAFQFGRKMSQQSARWETESQWIAANDHRTRHSHRDVNGIFVPEGQKFRVPIYVKGFVVGHDRMDGPGDDTATPGNIINCRCTMVTVAMRDAEGNLIRKGKRNPNISVLLPGEAVSNNPVITI